MWGPVCYKRQEILVHHLFLKNKVNGADRTSTIAMFRSTLTLSFIFTCLSVAVQSRSFVSQEYSSSWTTSLGSQTPGITPLQTHLANGSVTVIGSIHHDISSSHFQVDVLSYESESGKELLGCQIPLSHINDRIWETRITATGFGTVVVSWLFNNREQEETGLRLLLVDVRDCEYKDMNVTLLKDVDMIYFVPHDVIGYGDGSFDLFVRSEEVCGKGVCRIGFDAYGRRIVKVYILLQYNDYWLC